MFPPEFLINYLIYKYNQETQYIAAPVDKNNKYYKLLLKCGDSVISPLLTAKPSWLAIFLLPSITGKNPAKGKFLGDLDKQFALWVKWKNDTPL